MLASIFPKKFVAEVKEFHAVLSPQEFTTSDGVAKAALVVHDFESQPEKYKDRLLGVLLNFKQVGNKMVDEAKKTYARMTEEIAIHAKYVACLASVQEIVSNKSLDADNSAKLTEVYALLKMTMPENSHFHSAIECLKLEIKECLNSLVDLAVPALVHEWSCFYFEEKNWGNADPAIAKKLDAIISIMPDSNTAKEVLEFCRKWVSYKELLQKAATDVHALGSEESIELLSLGKWNSLEHWVQQVCHVSNDDAISSQVVRATHNNFQKIKDLF